MLTVNAIADFDGRLPTSKTETQYEPTSAVVEIWAVVLLDAFTEYVRPQIVPGTCETPSPSPMTREGFASVRVTVTGPAVGTAKVRDVAPPAASTLEKLSVVGPVGALGVVGVVVSELLPQPATSTD